MSAQPFRLNPVFITPETSTWLTFVSIVSSLGSHLHAWPGGTVDSFAFETSAFHYHLFSVLSPDHKTYYTNLAYFYLHLSRLQESFPSNPLTTPGHNVSSTFPPSYTPVVPVLLSLTTPILPLPCSTLCAAPIPFPIVSFPSSFCSVTEIDFTYHISLFASQTLWLDSILPLVQIIVKSFCLQYVCLFSRRYIAKPHPLHPFHSRIQDLCPTWFFSIHTLSSSSIGANVSWFHSLFYFYPHPLKLDSTFHVSTTEFF